MGETIRGGYYRGIDGKYRDANGNEVEERSEKSIEREVDKGKDATPRGAETPVPSAKDPGPLGPQIFPPPAEATKHAEASAKKEGVPGGKSSGGKSSSKK